MLSLRACSLFWSSFSIVSFVKHCMPLGKYSSKFWDKCKSVKFSRPLISSGISSSLFSETSRHTRLRRFPISPGSRWSWLWSNQSSWRDGKSPRWGGNSSISLSPKSRRSSFVSLLMDSGKCLRRFSRNSSDSSCDKLQMRKKGKNVIKLSMIHQGKQNISNQFELNRCFATIRMKKTWKLNYWKCYQLRNTRPLEWYT